MTFHYDTNAISDGDFETYSEADIKKTGAPFYAAHCSTEVLMYAWMNPGEKRMRQWFPLFTEMPTDLREIIGDQRVIFAAWNAPFEYHIFRHVLGIHIPWSRWVDPMVMAHSVSLPGALKRVGKILRLDDKYLKQESGTRLINKFSKPRKPTKNNPSTRVMPGDAPEDWKLFAEYNRFDVISQYRIRRQLENFNLPDHEWRLWHLDQKINETGMPVDMQLVDNAIAIADRNKTDLLTRAKVITGIKNPNSDAQLGPWIKASGVDLPNYQKGTVAKALKGDMPPVTREVLEMRAQWKKTSTRKFTKLKTMTGYDGRLRGAFQFAGAGRTWRWAGRGVQLQNLPRGIFNNVAELAEAVELVRNGDYDTIELFYDRPMDVISSVVRPAFRAPDGYRMIVSDLAAIEARVLGWLANCVKTLECFRAGRDVYKDFAVDLFGTPYEEVTKGQRTESKPAVLGCGFMLGGGDLSNPDDPESDKTGLWGYADSMGIKIDRALAHKSVKMWREAHPEVVAMWWALDAAARQCIETLLPVKVEGIPIEFDYKSPFMRCRLPSGRYLHYLRPRLEMQIPPWERGKPNPKKKLAITYEGLNNSGQWVRITTHPGKLTENIVQAIARDVLAIGLIEADKKGFEVIGHVHDEIITLVPEDLPLTVQDLNEAMITQPTWAPDLPLDAEGWEGIYYRKD
jgi:DNA polymerase